MLWPLLRRWACGGAACLAGVLVCGLVQAAEPDDAGLATVYVIGTGPSPEEARRDGLRQALQRVVPQVIAADRKIENDELVMDRVLSSMDGHIQSLHTVALEKTESGYSARMKVVIARRDIANFIAYQASGKVEFSGEALLAERTRELETRNFRSIFLSRFLRGYPARQMQTKVLALTPDRDNPDIVWAVVSYRLHPAFIQSVLGAVNAIACDESQGACSPRMICLEQPGSRNGACRALAVDQWTYVFLTRMTARPLGFALRFTGEGGQRVGSNFCFDEVVKSGAYRERTTELRWGGLLEQEVDGPLGAVGPVRAPVEETPSNYVAYSVSKRWPQNINWVYALQSAPREVWLPLRVRDLERGGVDLKRAKQLSVVPVVLGDHAQRNYDLQVSATPVMFDVMSLSGSMLRIEGDLQEQRSVGKTITEWPRLAFLPAPEVDAYEKQAPGYRYDKKAVPLGCMWPEGY